MNSRCPKIKFIYSSPYDRLLTEYENKVFTQKQAGEIEKYIRKLQAKWDKVSNSVCQILEGLVKNKWQEKEINCYVVKNCKYNGISNPLTLKLNPDFDYAIETLIHELAHIITSYNFEKWGKIEQKLKRQFPKENQRTVTHIYINFIELQILKKLFNQVLIDKFIKRNLKLKGIGRAWKIALKEGDNLKKLFRI